MLPRSVIWLVVASRAAQIVRNEAWTAAAGCDAMSSAISRA